MTRTCIIGGGPTGSREHIFPAALGGRRTNKGIYCGKHNGAYSGLAGIVAEQLAIFNAQLGVQGDHADEPTSVSMTDVASGQAIQLSSEGVKFASPQLRSETREGDQIVAGISFNNHKEAQEWLAEQKAKGVDIRFADKGERSTYYLGTAHKQVKLGGDEEGLRAIAYIAQTFFAHSFPELARTPALQGLKDYTLHNQGRGYASWDFETPEPNSFAFGHRVIVGLDETSGTAYARLSFFSTLCFTVILGKMTIEKGCAVITDIDPLAKAPPNDIIVRRVEEAYGAVRKPTNTVSLSEAISSGRANAQLKELMKRLADHERETAAARLLIEVQKASALPERERPAFFQNLVEGEAQRVFNLIGYVAKDFEKRATDPVVAMMVAFLKKAAMLEPSSANGLSDEATSALSLGVSALARQMNDDFKGGKLDQDRMSMLIGGGPGAHVVGMAVMQPFLDRLPK